MLYLAKSDLNFFGDEQCERRLSLLSRSESGSRLSKKLMVTSALLVSYLPAIPRNLLHRWGTTVQVSRYVR